MEKFLRAGRRSSRDIETILNSNHREFSSFKNVLDFGCGCGRTLLWLDSHSSSVRLRGTDIDDEAINWCRDALPHAGFAVNDTLPPLKYPDDSFDLVYAISVFTHPNKDYRFRWLSELQRITEPNGLVFLTIHGQHARGILPNEDIGDIEKDGFKFVASNDMRESKRHLIPAVLHVDDTPFHREGGPVFPSELGGANFPGEAICFR